MSRTRFPKQFKDNSAVQTISHFLKKNRRRVIISIFLWLFLTALIAAVWFYEYRPANRFIYLSDTEDHPDQYFIEVVARLYSDDGDLFAHKKYRCDLNITVYFFNESIEDSLRVGVGIDNALVSNWENPSTIYPRGMLFDMDAGDRQGGVTYWNETLGIEFQASGDSGIQIISIIRGQNIRHDDNLTQTIPVEPWSTHYQQEATRLTLIGMLFSIGIASNTIIASSKIDDNRKRHRRYGR